MTNRLAAATSPYLLQHAENPVEWWEWGADAFEEARRRDVPVLLSVGYAACHWCHVMAHESFEDATTAAEMNAGFVCVKVDREERPDVDNVYMTATQALTGSGGWPMTVFATPDGRPFYCGTYFPPRPAHGMPSFRQVLAAVRDAWTTKRADLETAGERIAAGISTRLDLGEPAALSADLLDGAVAKLAGSFDQRWGGFGGAPKFPPSMVLEFLLRNAARTGDATVLGMARRTAEAMARGGMYDQLAGGFARYSVDAQWVVPHFEKMLYDNALLLRVYLHLWRATGEGWARRVADETAAFLLRDLRTPEGGFASALDADTDGVEGLTYVWTPDQLVAVLGADDGRWAADLLEVTDRGTFEHGTSTLQLLADPDDERRWVSVRRRLLEARAERPQPARDDKVVTAWNGLAIAALAEHGVLTGSGESLAAARGAAELVAGTHWTGDRLRRASRDGVAGAHAGVLEDYGDLAEGLLALHAATAEGRWLELAGELLDVVAGQFVDAQGWHDTAADAETLLHRPFDPADGPTPAGIAAAAGAAVTHAALSGSPRHRELGEAALASLARLVDAAPRAAGWAAAVGEALLAGPLEVAVSGPAGPERDALALAARRSTSPGAVVVVGEPDAAGVPLLASRPSVDGRPAAYVCRGFVCSAPVTDVSALSAAMEPSAR
ncbi:thioredoxin domain-containing protein [Geodermatophilus sp. YIM 151500]|uniref:thioredoxin domain-containing protein n=1 Tax=Geodermatophilus sp. YIM 151500 TaxID=2984531 RepID=UPI0021E4D1ED|nr:thioredoxin domain-containing protein [Geodermatophilus sp. YIM 151500]MCV2489522.1 thioredoxin domain-containing protein [Geodermatophilus sp. YIM 151500]